MYLLRQLTASLGTRFQISTIDGIFRKTCGDLPLPLAAVPINLVLALA
jgi:hypothetical protein